MADKSGIRQIAQAAGVSVATVSRVLNGTANVSQAMRDAVLAAVSEHHYRPNAAAKALATKRTRTIAAVIPTLEHSIFAVFMNALEDQLALSGFNLVIATHQFDYQIELQRCNDVLRLGAEAVIVSGLEHDPELVKLLNDTDVPWVCTSVYSPESPYPCMGYNNAALAKQAILYLAALGHQHIRVLHGPFEGNDRMQKRVKGARDAHSELSGVCVDFHETSIGAGFAAEAFKQWQQQDNLPDACLCLADILALGVLHEAQRQRIAIPETFSLMGFENVDWAENCSPRLTTMALPSHEMGVKVAKALISHLDEGQPLNHMEFSASLIERETTCRR